MKKQNKKPKCHVRLVVPPPKVMTDRKKQASKDACRKRDE